jgi:hypothetical protein
MGLGYEYRPDGNFLVRKVVRVAASRLILTRLPIAIRFGEQELTAALLADKLTSGPLRPQ